MKKILSVIVMFAAAITVFAASDDVRDALYGAVDSVKISVQQAKFGREPVAILPIGHDEDSIIIGRLKNVLTSAGVNVVEGKEDPMWDEILKEIAWDERKDDILDAETLVKFGRLKAAKYLVYGKLNVLDENDARVYCEVELHAVQLNTKEHVWGGNFAYRYYKGAEIKGIITLDNAIRDLLKKNFKEAEESLKSPEYAGKLNSVKTVSVIPLSGDIDQYMTGLAIEILTKTTHIPMLSQMGTVQLVRSFINTGILKSDSIFYGAVRDLSRKAIPAEDTMTECAYEVNADIQLFLEDVKTGGILWSKTITLHDKEMVKKELTDKEKVEAEAVSFFSKHWRIFVYFIGGFFLIIAIGMAIGIIRSATDVR